MMYKYLQSCFPNYDCVIVKKCQLRRFRLNDRKEFFLQNIASKGNGGTINNQNFAYGF